MNKQALRVTLEIVVGMIASAVLFYFVIRFGYTEAAANNGAITFLGLEIFSFENGTENPNTNNMMLLGVVSSLLFVVLGELMFGRKKKTSRRAA